MKYPLKKILLADKAEIYLESAQLSDGPSLWQMGHTVAQDHEFQAMYPDEFHIKPEDEPKFIQDNEEHPCKLALLARSSRGEVVGMCNMGPASRLRKMSHIVSTGIGILPQYRDKKLGPIMMMEAIQTIKLNPSIEKIELHVLSTNMRAIALYQKLGFKEAGRSKNGFKFGTNDYRDDEFMELFLL